MTAERTLHVHTLTYRVRSKTIDLTEVSAWIDRHYTENLLSGSDPRTLDLDLELDGSPEVSPVRRPSDAMLVRTTLCFTRCFYRDGRFTTRLDNDAYQHSVECDVRSQRLRAVLGRGYNAADGQSIVINIVRPILHSFVMPFFGFVTLHGAVVMLKDRAVLLTGESGAGKSTVALTLGLAGHEVLADDAPLFRFFGNRALGLSSLDVLSISDRALLLHPSVSAHVVGRRLPFRKLAVCRTAFARGEAWRQPVPIEYIVELHRGNVDRPRLRRRSRGQILQRLLTSAMVVLELGARETDPMFRRVSTFVYEVIESVVSHAQVLTLEYANHHLDQLPTLLEHVE